MLRSCKKYWSPLLIQKRFYRKGASIDAVKQVFNRNTHATPCIYLFSIGQVKELKEELNIDGFCDQDYVYKWGRTCDLVRRTNEHTRTYGQIEGSRLELILFGFVDRSVLPQAERNLKNLFDEMDMILKHDVYQELAIIPKNKMKIVKEQFGLISKIWYDRSKLC